MASNQRWSPAGEVSRPPNWAKYITFGKWLFKTYTRGRAEFLRRYVFCKNSMRNVWLCFFWFYCQKSWFLEFVGIWWKMNSGTKKDQTFQKTSKQICIKSELFKRFVKFMMQEWFVGIFSISIWFCDAKFDFCMVGYSYEYIYIYIYVFINVYIYVVLASWSPPAQQR